MTTELTIPDAASVPAYIRDPEAAKIANEDAAAGISTGFPARVKLSGKQFSLVDGNGDETPYPPAKMVQGPDGNIYLPVIVLRAKVPLQKAWYVKKFNPNTPKNELVPPDCLSSDAERPDPASVAPQSEVCANCPMNAFGSGVDQDGNATDGKACADTKHLAVFVPVFGIHRFKIPPASLKNWGLYVKNLTAAGIPLGNVKTLIGFDLVATYPVLVFNFGGFIAEELLPKLDELTLSSEVEDIIEGMTVAAAAPKQVEAPPEPDKEVAESAQTTADDLDLGLGAPSSTEKAPPAAAGATSQDVTDDQLRESLGI